jgi:hypothetical protein
LNFIQACSNGIFVYIMFSVQNWNMQAGMCINGHLLDFKIQCWKINRGQAAINILEIWENGQQLYEMVDEI